MSLCTRCPASCHPHHTHHSQCLSCCTHCLWSCPLQASGFCYINDIVLAILELLKYHRCAPHPFTHTCQVVSTWQRLPGAETTMMMQWCIGHTTCGCQPYSQHDRHHSMTKSFTQPCHSLTICLTLNISHSQLSSMCVAKWHQTWGSC